MQILDVNGNVLAENETIFEMSQLVEKAVKQGCSLRNADLIGYYLGHTSLNMANLKGANLTNAALNGCDLRCANLEGANLFGANLSYTFLDSTKLTNANLKLARLPSPPMVLLANWGELSDELTADLMVWDSLNHPDPTTFDRWAEGGECPYIANSRVIRSAFFKEKRELWGKGKVCPPYKLMERVLAEKCPDW